MRPADSAAAARKLAQALLGDLSRAGYRRAAECLGDDRDRGLRFFQFPEPHGPHLRTINPIESVFRSVRLRTNAAKRFKKTRSGVFLVHQVIRRLEQNGKRLKAAHLCGTVPLPEAVKKQPRKPKVA